MLLLRGSEVKGVVKMFHLLTARVDARFRKGISDVARAINPLDILEGNSRSLKTRVMIQLADAADSLRYDFEGLHERATAGDTTQPARDRNRGKSSADIREEWAKHVWHKIDKLKYWIETTH